MTWDELPWGKIAALLIVFAILIVGFWPLFAGSGGPVLRAGTQAAPPASQPAETPTTGEQPGGASGNFAFNAPAPTAHLVATSPQAGEIQPAPPATAAVSFDLDLVAGSLMQVVVNNQDVSSGDTVIEGGKAMHIGINADAPGGLYTVNYHACWTDGNCQDGNFQFGVNR